jgi:poly(A) polymerase
MTEPDTTLSSEVATLLNAIDRALDPPTARDPLTAILLQPAVRRLLPILEQRGALARWLPELAALRGVSQLPDHQMDALDHSFQACASAPPTVLSRWTALLHDTGKATTVVHTPEGRTRFFGHELVGAELAAHLLPRLGFAEDFVAAVSRVIQLHLRPLSYRPSWTDGAVVRLQTEAGDLWPALLAQCRADLLGYAPERVDRALANLDVLAARAERIAHPPPPPPGSPLDGYELQALFGRPPGPWLREVKAVLEDAVLAGRLAPGDKASAAALARRILEET